MAFRHHLRSTDSHFYMAALIASLRLSDIATWIFNSDMCQLSDACVTSGSRDIDDFTLFLRARDPGGARLGDLGPYLSFLTI